MAEFLNKNIKHLRTNIGLSQQNLADKVGIDRSTISRIENEEIETTIDNAIKIAETLNVPLADLINKDLTKTTDIVQTKFEMLFDKTKDILSDDDRATIEFIMQKTINNYENSKK